jgi:hypothetical protein
VFRKKRDVRETRWGGARYGWWDIEHGAGWQVVMGSLYFDVEACSGWLQGEDFGAECESETVEDEQRME